MRQCLNYLLNHVLHHLFLRDEDDGDHHHHHHRVSPCVTVCHHVSRVVSRVVARAAVLSLGPHSSHSSYYLGGALVPSPMGGGGLGVIRPVPRALLF